MVSKYQYEKIQALPGWLVLNQLLIQLPFLALVHP